MNLRRDPTELGGCLRLCGVLEKVKEPKEGINL